MSKRKPRWEKHTLKMKPDHTWKAPPGYNILVLDRGAVRLNYPHAWIVRPTEDCMEVVDKEEPDDNCRLAVSYIRLPPGVDWSKLPLRELVEAAIKDDQRGKLLGRGKMTYIPRGDVEVAWIEIQFIDQAEDREAHSRLAIARGQNIQALITFDFWAEDAAHLEPVWDEALRSIRLGREVFDPTKGD